MNLTAEQMKHVNLADFLRGIDVRPSHQRVEILRYLVRSEEHPTVQRIYDDLVPVNPTLSKTTVYNTLKLFVDRQIAEEITIEGSEARYDLHDPSHGHFKCLECGRIFDIPYPVASLQKRLPGGFVAHEIHVHFAGTCADCRSRT